MTTALTNRQAALFAAVQAGGLAYGGTRTMLERADIFATWLNDEPPPATDPMGTDVPRRREPR